MKVNGRVSSSSFFGEGPGQDPLLGENEPAADWENGRESVFSLGVKTGGKRDWHKNKGRSG